MAQAYVPIQTVTVGSGGSASISFTNIPATYTDLLVKLSARGTDSGTGANDGRLTFNGSSTGYSSRLVYGTGGATGSASNSGSYMYWVGGAVAGGHTASTFSNSEIYIPNYAGSTNKSVSFDGVNENNGTYGSQLLTAGLWSNTAAITSISLALDYNNFAQYSTATLYGIGGARASGGTITADAQYTYHTFTSSGTFTALEKIKGAEILVIAGGASGGMNGAGGGGAGGLAHGTSQSLSAGTSFPITVGAGGAGVSGASGTGSVGNNGSNSSFSSIVAVGGGGGGAWNGSNAFVAANSGGSGGGSVNPYPAASLPLATSTQTSGLNYIGYGNSGGVLAGSPSYAHGAGGGGAGAQGGSTSSTAGGAGGVGLSTFSAWGYATSTGALSGGIYYYAGGGGGANDVRGSGTVGGVGGLGGGGAAGGITGTAGTANTGGGGGAASFGNGSSQSSGAGGSGLVIIRYPN